jgi:hypothetical protein
MKYGPCGPVECRCRHSSSEHLGKVIDAAVYAKVWESAPGCLRCDCAAFRPVMNPDGAFKRPDQGASPGRASSVALDQRAASDPA